MFEAVQNPPAGYVVHGYTGDGAVSATDLLTNNPLISPRSTALPASIDVTAFVQQLVTNGGDSGYAGLVLSGFTGGSGFSFRSSEPFIGAPLLTIQSVPEPITPAALAACGLVLNRRRRRTA
jgi:hypothetical protein